MWLEVLETNVRARRLYESLGYQPTGSTDGVLTMRFVAP